MFLFKNVTCKFCVSEKMSLNYPQGMGDHSRGLSEHSRHLGDHNQVIDHSRLLSDQYRGLMEHSRGLDPYRGIIDHTRGFTDPRNLDPRIIDQSRGLGDLSRMLIPSSHAAMFNDSVYRDPNLVNRIPTTLYPPPQPQILPPVYCKAENQLLDYDARELAEANRCNRDNRDSFEVQPEPGRSLQQQLQQQAQIHQQHQQSREPQLQPQQASQPQQQQATQPSQPTQQLPTQPQPQQG